MKKQSKKCSYFEMPNFFLWSSVLLFVLYIWSLGVLAYFPEWSPYEYMGQFGQYSKHIYTERYCKVSIIIIFWSTLTAHICEAIYVSRLALSLNMNAMCLFKWAMCAMWIGYPSTRLLMKYAKKNQKNK